MHASVLVSALMVTLVSFASADQASVVSSVQTGLEQADRGQLKEAEQTLRGALADLGPREATLSPPEKHLLVTTLDALGALVLVTSPLEAEALFRRAVKLSDGGSVRHHRELAHSLNNLAAALLEGGQTAHAGRMARKSMQAYESAFGPRHPESGNALTTLAEVSLANGDRDEAERLLKEADRLASLEGGTPLLQAAIAARLGALRLLGGRYVDAEALLERAVDLAEGVVGSDHPALQQMLQLLAECYRLRNRTEDAEAYYERALTLSVRLHGGPHPTALPSLSGLALLAERRGDRGRAGAFHGRVVALAEDALDAQDPVRAVYVARAASYYGRNGQPRRAEALFASASSIVEACAGKCDAHRAVVLEDLFAHYVEGGRASDAARIRLALARVRESGPWIDRAAPSPYDATLGEAPSLPR